MIARVWAMPSRHTFTIAPIRQLLERWGSEGVSVDPFAGWNSPAANRNDINPEAPTDHHEDAAIFVERFERIDLLLFDPPYSPRQISECYRSAGLPVSTSETQNARLYASVKDAAAKRMPLGAVAICCGWNSNGMGKARGFAIAELLIVAHGAAHNDTIVTVERRVK